MTRLMYKAARFSFYMQFCTGPRIICITGKEVYLCDKIFQIFSVRRQQRNSQGFKFIQSCILRHLFVCFFLPHSINGFDIGLRVD